MAPREGLFWRESRTEIESLESGGDPRDCRKIRKKPTFCLFAKRGLLRITYCGQFPNQTEKLREPDLNRRPRGYEPRELPGCSIPRDKWYSSSRSRPPPNELCAKVFHLSSKSHSRFSATCNSNGQQGRQNKQISQQTPKHTDRRCRSKYNRRQEITCRQRPKTYDQR
jgi:hypothetical protein